MRLINNRYEPYLKLIEQQEKHLTKLISYVYKFVPYYKTLFDNHKINPSEIKTIKDLERIPILTREIIQNNIDKFKPKRGFIKFIDYFEYPTGGTTGTPLMYKISRMDRIMAASLLYRGWSNAGYELGDKMVFLSGSSLSMNSKNKLWLKTQEFFRNTKKLSAFDLDKESMAKYCEIINDFRPKFIRGYPSAIYFFSKYIEEFKIEIWSPKAILTTSEVLHPEMREQIEKTFNCRVFDAYGLNDGGVSAFECDQHNGLHIDGERGILQVVDDNGKNIDNGMGSIIATDLYNYVFPFIRYDTGDIGEIEQKSCSCKLNTPRLIKIIGRSVDVLVTPEGKSVPCQTL